MKYYIIPEDVLVAVKSYLYTKPYQEVAKGIMALEKLEQYQPVTPSSLGAPPVEVVRGDDVHGD